MKFVSDQLHPLFNGFSHIFRAFTTCQRLQGFNPRFWFQASDNQVEVLLIPNLAHMSLFLGQAQEEREEHIGDIAIDEHAANRT